TEVALQELSPIPLHVPRQRRRRESPAQHRRGRQRMHNVPEGAGLNEQDIAKISWHSLSLAERTFPATEGHDNVSAPNRPLRLSPLQYSPVKGRAPPYGPAHLPDGSRSRRRQRSRRCC